MHYVCVCVSTIKSKSIVYLFPFTLISDFINIRRAGVVLCLFVFSGGKAGRKTKILTIHPSIRCDVGSHANSPSLFLYAFLR